MCSFHHWFHSMDREYNVSSHNRNDTKVMIHQHITENNSDTIDLSNIALFNRYSQRLCIQTIAPCIFCLNNFHRNAQSQLPFHHQNNSHSLRTPGVDPREWTRRTHPGSQETELSCVYFCPLSLRAPNSVFDDVLQYN